MSSTESEDSGGVLGLRAWVTAATERAVRLFPFAEGATAGPADYDSSVAELTALTDLLDHDPALRGAVTVRLGSVLTMRHLAAGGAPEDRERAQLLLRSARDPGTEVGAGTSPEDRRWAALFLLMLVMPVREMGGGINQKPAFSTLFDWQTRQDPAGTAAAAAEMRELTAEVAQLPLPPELMEQIQQASTLISTLTATQTPAEMGTLVDNLPDGFPYAHEMRLMMAMLTETAAPAAQQPGTAPGTGTGTETGRETGTGAGAGATTESEPEARTASDPAGTAGSDGGETATAVNAILPAVFSAMEATRSGDPEVLNQAIRRLRTAHQQLPPGHEMASLTETLIGSLLHLGQGVGGNLQDVSVARTFTESMTEKLAMFADPTNPAATEFALVSDLFMLIDQVHQADEAGDAEAARELVDKLDALVRATPQDHNFRLQALLGLGQACTTLGRLTGDKDMLLRGIAHQEQAVSAGGIGAEFAKEWLASLTTGHSAVRAALTEDPALIRDHAPLPPDASASERWGSALSLLTRYGLTRSPADLDAAVGELEQVRDGVRRGEIPHFAADALWQLAECYRTRWTLAQDEADLAAATDTAMEALQELAADVVLQLGAEHGLLVARSGASRGMQAAVWAASSGRVEEAVAALELGRALVLQAASTSRAVPELLEARGHQELADAWRASGAADTPAGLPAELPSTLRRRALEALGYRRQGLFTTPTVSELADGVAAGGADALVYLLPGEDETPGVAIVVGPEVGIGVGPLPQLSGTESGPLERYLDAAAARSANVHDPAAEQAWEEALSELCGWAFQAALGTVLKGITGRIGAGGEHLQDRGGDGPVPPRVVLVPCGRLGVVPWHAARLPDGAPADYACQLMVISYAASGSQFLRTVRRAPRHPAAAPVLVADPRQELTRAEQEATALHEAFYPGARMYGEFFEPPAPPEATGTPDELLALLADAPSLLHVASHGSAGVRPTVSALHLAFPDGSEALPAAQGGPGAAPDLGMLTVTRLLDRAAGQQGAPDGPLVVLSACETDLSTRDHDEALTLTTAFVSSGARDVVGSRWTTQDGASALMMAVFHHFLAAEGRSPADALRAAQMWMLDPDREDPGSLRGELLREMERPGLDRLPVWAAFIHQGHPGPGKETVVNPEERLLSLVGEHRDSVRESLGEEQHALLVTRLRDLAHVPPDDTKAMRRALQGVRLALLPLPLAHPVRLALDSVRLAGAPVGPPVVTGARQLLLRLTEPAPHPDTLTIIRTAQARLLEEPALNLMVMCARCHAAGFEEPPPELIRLDDPVRGARYPAFQFTGESGGPVPVVLRINRLLLAEIDPWGVADWWLSGNTWLGGSPASLLGELPDQQLVGAATALVEGDG